MAKVSVLMSVYNESGDEIRQSVESILNQTFVDFELIIINDNILNAQLHDCLEKIEQKDIRIKVYHNKQNIGLAMSMNKAASYASGQYFARMDADDISEVTRFEKQVELLDSGRYDLICTNFVRIDENGNVLDKEPVEQKHDGADLKGLIYRRNFIHHPTVMMTRQIFELVGGYRNFPCTQDLDLWMRMEENGCRIHMIHESLLRYRIRQNSTTLSKGLQQKLTVYYIRELALQRAKTGKDSYSYDEYLNFIRPYLESNSANGTVATGNKKLRDAEELKKQGKKISCMVARVVVFFSDSVNRKIYIKMKVQRHKLKKLAESKKKSVRV